MLHLDRKGFTLVEAVASFFVISLVLTTAVLLIASVRDQAEATRIQVAAVQVGTLIREDVESDATYAAVSAWMAGSAKSLTNTTCDDPGSPYACTLFAYENGGLTFTDAVVIHFEAPTAESLQFRVIRFTVVITYYGARTVELQGMICDA